MDPRKTVGGPHHQGVALHQGRQVVVAPADDGGHRQAAPQGGIDHQPVAPVQAVVAQLQPAEAVVPVGIDTGVVEHQIRTHLIQQIRQGPLQGPQVGVIPDAVLQGQVEVARLLVQGEVAGRVHREGEHPGVACEDRRRTVPLVHVQVHHQHLPHQALGQQHPGRHGAVVEDAEAAAMQREGVVGAAGQVAGQAVAQGQPGREHRAPHRQPAASHQGLRHRQADAAHLLRTQPSPGEGLVVAAAVHHLHPSAWCRQRLVDLPRAGQLQLLQPLLQQPELLHREAMAAGQGDRVGRVINQRRPHQSPVRSSSRP